MGDAGGEKEVAPARALRRHAPLKRIETDPKGTGDIAPRRGPVQMPSHMLTTSPVGTANATGPPRSDGRRENLATTSESSQQPTRCTLCGVDFGSGNKLFSHLRDKASSCYDDRRWLPPERPRGGAKRRRAGSVREDMDKVLRVVTATSSAAAAVSAYAALHGPPPTPPPRPQPPPRPPAPAPRAGLTRNLRWIRPQPPPGPPPLPPPFPATLRYGMRPPPPSPATPARPPLPAHQAAPAPTAALAPPH